MYFRKHQDSKTMLKLSCQTQPLLYMSCWVKHSQV